MIGGATLSLYFAWRHTGLYRTNDGLDHDHDSDDEDLVHDSLAGVSQRGDDHSSSHTLRS